MDGSDTTEPLLNLQHIHFPSGSTYLDTCRFKAVRLLEHNELEAIYNLSISHSQSLRFKACFQFDKSGSDHTNPRTINKTNLQLACDSDAGVQIMLDQIAELPKEWTIVQLTPMYSRDSYLIRDSNKQRTDSLHVTVFNCGQREMEPFSVIASAPIDKISVQPIEICEEMQSLIVGMHKLLTGVTGDRFRNDMQKKSYCERREDQNNRLRNLVKDIQDLWLGPWKYLFIGKLKDIRLEKKLSHNIDEYLEREGLKFSLKEKCILSAFIKGREYMTFGQIKQAVQMAFSSLAIGEIKKVCKFIGACNDELALHSAERHPVILIVDHKLDFLPWEMIDVLQDHPVSRMPSLQFTYALYKEHESTIKNGVKTGLDAKNGAYIIDPEQNLTNMQARLLKFLKYWTKWDGLAGVAPTSSQFEEMLSHDILSYSGHGSGSQFLPGEKIQKMRVNGVILLFGCRSVELTVQGHLVERTGHHDMYMIACSPCVVGMLWTVTDIDTDRLTTEFLSQWLPSDAKVHWKDIDKKIWQQGHDIVAKNSALASNGENEPELLRALAKAKKCTKQYITSAACVARGLPVRIV